MKAGVICQIHEVEGFQDTYSENNYEKKREMASRNMDLSHSSLGILTFLKLAKGGYRLGAQGSKFKNLGFNNLLYRVQPSGKSFEITALLMEQAERKKKALALLI